MEQCLNKPDASIRQWKILDRSETQKINSALQGKFLASLWCPLDATVEPHLILKEVRNSLLQSSNYIFRNNVDIIDVTSSSEKAIAIARNGEIFESDLIVLCPGADHSTLFKDQFDTAPVRRVRLQMMSTEPFTQQLSTSIADGDSLRYYPAYDVPALRELPEQTSIAKQKNMQLLMVQRLDGTLTIGDTHEFDEPFEFKLEEEPYTYLHEVASELIGSRLPSINKRWDGIYSQRIDGAVCDRRQIASNIVSVTGPGGRGNTLAPAIAETTMKAFL
jgi:glycine/D-amino acid oxidase-like deaminating enzyme